jgi:hypothetical protein
MIRQDHWLANNASQEANGSVNALPAPLEVAETAELERFELGVCLFVSSVRRSIELITAPQAVRATAVRFNRDLRLVTDNVPSAAKSEYSACANMLMTLVKPFRRQ